MKAKANEGEASPELGPGGSKANAKAMAKTIKTIKAGDKLRKDYAKARGEEPPPASWPPKE